MIGNYYMLDNHNIFRKYENLFEINKFIGLNHLCYALYFISHKKENYLFFYPKIYSKNVICIEIKHFLKVNF